MGEKHPGGRPLLFKNEKILREKIDDYFRSCFEERWKDEIKRDKNGNKVMKNGEVMTYPVKERVMISVPTVSGLAVALKTSRQTLINYESNEEFFDTIKSAKQYIESIIEQGSVNGTLNPTASIFNLKNNFDWKDKTENEIYGKGGRPLMPELSAQQSRNIGEEMLRLAPNITLLGKKSE